MGDSHADISKHVKSYIVVFIVLAIMTVVTVAASRYDFGSGNVAVALMIAAFKASLVIAIFMHMKWEKSTSIWWPLLICAICFTILMVVPVLTVNDYPPQVVHHLWDTIPVKAAEAATHH